MKVRELIELLQEYDPEDTVHYAYDYGDYWHTTVAPEITEVHTGLVRMSDYHRMMRLVEDTEEDKTGEPAVLLR